MSDRAQLLRDDALAAPERLRDVLAAWTGPPIATGPVRFLGLGSSRFASLVVAAALTRTGRVARVEIASAAPAPPIPGEVVFAVSASGRTREVVAAARVLEGACPVIAVTNDVTSPLAAGASRCLALEAGTEASGIATSTYRATIALLALATGAITAESLGRAVDAFGLAEPGYLATVAERLDAAPSIDVVAPAALLGAAEQAALMLREGPRLRAIAWELGEWLHTAIYTALPGHRLLTLPAGDDDPGREVAKTVRGRGGEAVELVAAPAPADPLVAALVVTQGAELLAADLWSRTATLDSTEVE